MTLGIHERQTPKVTGCQGVPVCDYHLSVVTRCQRVSPTCPWQGESSANPWGALPLCVCMQGRGWAGSDSVVKKRRSLNTDQVALISLRGGSLASVAVARQTQYAKASKHTLLLLLFFSSYMAQFSRIWFIFFFFAVSQSYPEVFTSFRLGINWSPARAMIRSVIQVFIHFLMK